MKHLLFVYGTLKTGHTRHKHLAGQRYLGTAILTPTHRMVYLGGFPALVPPEEGQDGSRVCGELYEVDELCLQEVDKVEGVDRGMFERQTLTLAEHVPMMLPTDQGTYNLLEKNEIEAYVYKRAVGQSRDCGCFWF